MNVLVLHDTCTESVSYCISCCLVHQLSSLSGMLSTINRVSSKTEHTVIAKCPLVNTTLRYLRQDLHSLVQQITLWSCKVKKEDKVGAGPQKMAVNLSLIERYSGQSKTK